MDKQIEKSLATLLADSKDGILREYGHSIFVGKRALEINARRQHSLLSFNPYVAESISEAWKTYVFDYVV